MFHNTVDGVIADREKDSCSNQQHPSDVGVYPFIPQANTKGFSDAVFRVLVDSLLLIDAALVSM
ncbi:hypothetical protein D030_3219 [Vibrio parahaemolyticus AQ3810]|nr:hypothetical protein D030_3219 [Vibrio parahaemolyticus AQ3810]